MKDSIENKLNPEERQKARVIGQVDTINTTVLIADGEPDLDSESYIKDKPAKEVKKEKLDFLSKTPEENLEKL